MTFLHKIATDLGALTEAQLERGAKQALPKEPNETTLATLTGAVPIALFSLAHEYQKQSRKLLFHGLYEMDLKDANPVLMEARELDALADITRDLAWLETRREIGQPAWESGTIGLRNNWEIVKVRDEDYSEEVQVKVAAVKLSDLLSTILKGAVPPATPPKSGEKPS